MQTPPGLSDATDILITAGISIGVALVIGIVFLAAGSLISRVRGSEERTQGNPLIFAGLVSSCAVPVAAWVNNGTRGLVIGLIVGAVILLLTCLLWLRGRKAERPSISTK